MLEFIVTNLPIFICVIAGLALLLLEVFMPGFGLPGIGSLILLLVSVGMVWARIGVLAAFGLLLIIVALIAIILSVTLKSAASGRLSKSPIILKETENGYNASDDMSIYIGREGEAKTVLRPSGIANFDDVRLNVVTDGVYIRQGAKVRISRVEGSRIIVEEI
ncbi:MAG: hypothetical protein FWF69_09850 [Firmicutes bacterium]|nr:hypothetical protein [Bacillota bacterium]